MTNLAELPKGFLSGFLNDRHAYRADAHYFDSSANAFLLLLLLQNIKIHSEVVFYNF